MNPSTTIEEKTIIITSDRNNIIVNGYPMLNIIKPRSDDIFEYFLVDPKNNDAIKVDNIHKREADVYCYPNPEKKMIGLFLVSNNTFKCDYTVIENRYFKGKALIKLIDYVDYNEDNKSKFNKLFKKFKSYTKQKNWVVNLKYTPTDLNNSNTLKNVDKLIKQSGFTEGLLNNNKQIINGCYSESSTRRTNWDIVSVLNNGLTYSLLDSTPMVDFPDIIDRTKSVKPPINSFKVLTYNVNHESMKEDPNFQNITDFVLSKAYSYDFIGLQEVAFHKYNESGYTTFIENMYKKGMDNVITNMGPSIQITFYNNRFKLLNKYTVKGYLGTTGRPITILFFDDLCIINIHAGHTLKPDQLSNELNSRYNDLLILEKSKIDANNLSRHIENILNKSKQVYNKWEPVEGRYNTDTKFNYKHEKSNVGDLYNGSDETTEQIKLMLSTYDIILMGDFNMEPSNFKLNILINGKVIPRNMKGHTEQNTCCQSIHTIYDSLYSSIDHILVSDGFERSDRTVLKVEGLASDHVPVSATLTRKL